MCFQERKWNLRITTTTTTTKYNSSFLLMMEVIVCSEMLLSLYQTMWHHIPSNQYFPFYLVPNMPLLIDDQGMVKTLILLSVGNEKLRLASG
jgi:hypothetical protein